ncbi:MAG: NAD(P)H-hydrate dehydratase [Rhodobacteraceae bacterium]|nr:NAD(P)H-hydrate dehydratase [Paracoccaceae bacterium]
MTELLTAAQMRAIEQAAIDSGDVTGLELMERAGRGVVEAILEAWPEMALTSQKAVVLCGPGNNGGDGFVVARLLKHRGWEVEVFLYGEVEKLPPDAKANADRWLEMGTVEPFAQYQGRKGWSCDLVLDALFGTGLTRNLMPLGGLFWEMEDMVDCFAIETGHKRGRPAIVAVDFPSGICSDSGEEYPHEEHWQRFSAMAHLTVSFHRAKCGHFLSEGPSRSGKVVTKSIGLDGFANKGGLNSVPIIIQPVRLLTLPMPLKRPGNLHKFSHGHALILSGPAGRTGAARLAARGALRIGAGVVSLACPQEAMAECAAQLTAIMLSKVEDAEALHAVLQDPRINALCLGPALGVDERGRGLVEAAIGGANPRPTILDADALTILAQNPELFAKLHKNCVVTPHAGEFKRLFPDIMAKLEAPATTGPAYSKVDATREAAARAGCVVLFKGADTVIADETGRAAINSAHYERAAPWLATAGAGDVLAGFITGLMARGFAPMQAAETAAWLHVECALKFGPGLIAEDIPEQLPAVFRDLEL